jgi:serine/threonine-protein kinase
MFRYCLSLTAIVLTTASARADEAASRLAATAKAVLVKNCSRCHANGQAEGGFGFVLDAKQLVERKKVTAGNSAKSRLFKKVQSGEMPPEDEKPRPTAEEITALKAWIDAGAPAFPATAARRPFQSEESALALVRDHLRNLPAPSGQQFQRYFTLTHLHNNASVSDEDLRWQRAALAKAVNSLSWKPGIVVPKALNKDQTVFAVDLRDLDWDRRRVWDEVSKQYPYGLKLDGQRDEQTRSVATEVYRLSGTDLPVLRADWFVATATRPPLYHTILDLPDKDAKLEQLLRVDAKENFLRDKLARAGFAKSGVSSQNRLIERHEAAYGAYWKSFDFKSNDGAGNLFRFPLGPAFKDNPFADQAFAHAGGELIFHLPNGLQAYLLVNGKGQRIDEGPTDVVSDTNKSSGTVAIVTGLSCMVCHKHGMIREGFKDELRDGAGVAGAARDKVQQLHRTAEDFTALMKDDENRFLTALDRAVGPFLKVGPDKDKDIREFTDEPIGRVVRAYHRDLTLQDAATELGLADAQGLANSIVGNNRLRELGLGALTNGGTLKRDAWSSVEQRLSPFQRAALELDRGSPHLPF